MNILHITTYMQGGAGRVIMDLACIQKKNGHKVTIIMNDNEEAGYENYNEYLVSLKSMGIEFYRINSIFKRDIFLNVEAAKFISKIIEKDNIDLIHSHAATPSMVSILGKNGSKKKIPIIQTMHGWGTNKNINQENMDVTLLNLVSKVICVSKSDKKLLVDKGVELNNIEVVYNGVNDLEEVLAVDDDMIKIKENSEYGKTIIGCIGTVCNRKNQRMIIEALREIDNDNINVIFIGEGDEIQNLQSLASEYGISDKVYFTGYKDKAYKYIEYLDYVILPSLSEGLPITVLESFRAGKPVIVSNIETLKEIVSDGENGFIFDLNSLQSLIQVIKNTVTHRNTVDYKKMCDEGRSLFDKKYKINRMYSSYNEIYIKVLES